MEPWLQEVVLGAARLLIAVDTADEVLVTDKILDAAANLRAVFDSKPSDNTP